MKIFPLSHDIIHQIDYVAPFNDLTIVNEFSTLIPMHGRFSLDAFQKVFSLPSEFYGNRSDDFVILDSVGFLRWGWSLEMVVIFQIVLQDLVVLSDFFLVTEIASVQNTSQSSSSVRIERWMGFTGAVMVCCIIILGLTKCIILAMV